jgi:hypothetical protein
MSKKKRIIWAVVSVVFLLILGIYLIPRIMICNSYHKMISRPLALETLSIKPQIINLPEHKESCLFSLGFAEMSLCPDSINAVRYHKRLGLICKTDSNSFTYNFLFPQDSVDVNDWAQKRIFGIKDFYDLELSTVNAQPWTYSRIFLSKPCKSMPYILLLAKFKISDSFNERGIGLFETDNIKGFIGFGTKKNPCGIKADIFSKDGKIEQTVVVQSDSAEKSKEALFSLLSSYRFMISSPEDVNVLDEMVMAEFSDNNKFKILDINE